MLIFVLYLGLVFFILAELRVVVIIYYLFTERRRKHSPASPDAWPPTGGVWPSVVFQLPVYREHQVLHRFLSAVVQMQYPAGRLAVQVLDDSEGDEARLAAEIVDASRDGPIRVEYVHRSKKRGTSRAR